MESNTLLFVDHENVGKLKLSLVPDGVRVMEQEIERLVTAMIAKKTISEADGKLAYHF